MSSTKTLLEILEIGKLQKEIKANMSSGNEKVAYDLLGDLNDKLSDLNGQVLEMEDVISIN